MLKVTSECEMTLMFRKTGIIITVLQATLTVCDICDNNKTVIMVLLQTLNCWFSCKTMRIVIGFNLSKINQPFVKLIKSKTYPIFNNCAEWIRTGCGFDPRLGLRIVFRIQGLTIIHLLRCIQALTFLKQKITCISYYVCRMCTRASWYAFMWIVHRQLIDMHMRGKYRFRI